MINVTNIPIIRRHGRKLSSLCRQALDSVNAILQDTDGTHHYPKKILNSFVEDFSRGNQISDMDEKFLTNAFGWSQCDDRGTGAAGYVKAMCEYFPLGVPANFLATYRRGLRMFFVELWCQGGVSLPTNFLAGSHFPLESFKHELLDWMASLTANVDAGVGYKKSARWRLKNYGHRLLWATDWNCVEDISLEDLATLQRAMRLREHGHHPYSISTSPFPFSELAFRAHSQFKERVTFSEEDYKKYCDWTVGMFSRNCEFNEFTPREKKYTKRGLHPVEAHVADDPSDFRPGVFRKLPGFSILPVAEAAAVVVGSFQEALLAHERICEYVRRGVPKVGRRWQLGKSLSYEGREKVDCESIISVWSKCFDSYLRHRLLKDVSDDADDRHVLNILTDYLCLYLPWWREQFGNPVIQVPLSPKQFNRYAFVSRDEDVSIQELPLTIIQFVRLRRSTAGSMGAAMRVLCNFFQYVEVTYRDDDEVAGRSYRAPMVAEFDKPKSGKYPARTTKEVIPERIYGHLLFYGYALEAFGEYLFNQVASGAISALWAEAQLHFDCAALGFVPNYSYRGQIIEVREVPNVFHWHERTLVATGKSSQLPHPTSLRLMLSALESGLRLQSLQWLDRQTFDKENDGFPEGGKTYLLYVNTDKLNKPWITVVVHRVRDLLKREIEFQSRFIDFETQKTVKYKNGSDVFEPLMAIFRSPTNDSPILDEFYRSVWVALLVSFQEFYRGRFPEVNIDLYSFEAVCSALDNLPQVKSLDKRGALLYCPTRVSPVYTPHSCRSSFITNRQAHGMPLEDAQYLVGHTSPISTGYYTKFSREQLRARMEASEKTLLGDFICFEPLGSEDSPYIRADKADSALRRAFSENRDEAIKSFRFISIASWSMEEEEARQTCGVDRLRNGPMGSIVWRETHACPVGEACPKEVLDHMGGIPKHCGMCPLAVKCIDHLTAIAAKINSLKIEINFLAGQISLMVAAKEPQTSIDAIWDKKQLLASECAAWELSEQILLKELEIAKTEGRRPSSAFLVQKPEAVVKHLTRVTRNLTEAQFLLQNLGEVNAYRGFMTPTQEKLASLAAKKLMAGKGLTQYEGEPPVVDALDGAVRMVGLMLKASGRTLQDVKGLSFESSEDEPLALLT